MHLAEIDLIRALDVFREVCIPEEVKNELKRNRAREDVFRKVKVLNLSGRFKDVADILVNKFSLDLGEAQAIALSLQERTSYFLTDDLDARETSKRHGVEAHGTVGVILRAFREKVVDKETAVKKVRELYTSSSLFITKDLINQITGAIDESKNR